MLKNPPRVRDNNGALQVRLRLEGRDHFINRLGRFDDPIAQARVQAICFKPLHQDFNSYLRIFHVFHVVRNSQIRELEFSFLLFIACSSGFILGTHRASEC